MNNIHILEQSSIIPISDETKKWYRRVSVLDHILLILCWVSIVPLAMHLLELPILDTLGVPCLLYVFFFILFFHPLFRYCYDQKIVYTTKGIDLKPRWGFEGRGGVFGFCKFKSPEIKLQDINQIIIFDSKYRLFSAFLFLVFPFFPLMSMVILGKSVEMIFFFLLLFSGIISIFLMKYGSKYFVVPEYYLRYTQHNCWKFLLGTQGKPFERQYRCTLAITVLFWIMVLPAFFLYN